MFLGQFLDLFPVSFYVSRLRHTYISWLVTALYSVTKSTAPYSYCKYKVKKLKVWNSIEKVNRTQQGIIFYFLFLSNYVDNYYFYR